MKIRPFAATFVLLCSLVTPVLAMQTDNHGIHAVPAPGKVTIDGDLSDWDTSGQVLMCYDVKSLKDVYSARVSMMHDAANFYAAIHWQDATPMGNSHDPQFQPDRGWAGDCLQLRIKTDRISHVSGWYYAKKAEPFIDITYGKGDHPFGGGDKNYFRTTGWKLQGDAEMAFKKDADGKGYVQELKLPWKLITDSGAAPASGVLACGLELLWGEADWPVHRYADNLATGQTSREFFFNGPNLWGPVTLDSKGHLTLPVPAWEGSVVEAKPQGPVKIIYQLAKAQRVTLAIDDAGGKRVRNLLAAAERPAGPNVDLWDCLDDHGNLVPPGNYTVKGLSHDALHLTYQENFADPGNPSWATADGKGAYYADHTPPEAVAFGPDGGALACPLGEGGKHLIGIDLQGHRQWGVANRMFGLTDRITLATDGKLVYTGTSEGKGRFFIWRTDLKTGDYAPWPRLDEAGKQVMDLVVRDKDGNAQCRAMAIHHGELAVILCGERKVALINGASGDTLKEIVNLPEAMAGCAYRPDGKLVVAAASGLILVDTAAGTFTALGGTLTPPLDDPRGVAVDAAGRIYVSQRGGAMNVVTFDAGGHRLGSIGVAGGRPATGFFNEKGMLNPAQIAIDAKGRLWVTESDLQPKRTSIWNTADGSLAFDLIGPGSYGDGGYLDPYDTNSAFCGLVEYRRGAMGQPLRPHFVLTDSLGTGAVRSGRFGQVRGHEYLQIRGMNRNAPMVKIYVRRPDGGWRHCAEFGVAGVGDKIDDPQSKDWNQRFKTPLWEGLFGKSYCWVDANDDGIAQREELQTADEKFGGGTWGLAMGADMTVVEPQGSTLWSMKPGGFTPGGTPLYTLASAKKIAGPGGAAGGHMLFVGRDGRSYINTTPLKAISDEGAELWTYPNDYPSVHGSHRAPAARAGLLIGPNSIVGSAVVNQQIGEVFYMNGNLGENFLFTEDGLWVQSVFNDCRGWYDTPESVTAGMPCDSMSAGGESFGGWFSKTSDGKYKVCLACPVVLDLSGLDTLSRFWSKVEVRPADLAAANDLRVRLAAATQEAKVLHIQEAATPPTLDAGLAAWGMESGSAEISGGGGVVGRAKASYDAQNLYLAWAVKDNSPLKNGGQDDRIMFITGDAVDVMLRTSDSRESKPVAGDLRLLLTLKGGKPMAVLYQPVAPTASRSDAAELSSPVRRLHFDSVKTVDIPLSMKPVPGGYTVTAAVPLSLLGLKSLKGKILRGDFGILLSDNPGQECTSRNYWANKTTNNTNDIPDEAMLTPALWSELRFE